MQKILNSALTPLNPRGFTLIELLVVVLIIGILAAVALPQYTRAVDKSRTVKDIPLVKSIFKAQEIYFMETGRHTTDDDELSIDIPYKTKQEYTPGRYAYRLHSNVTLTLDELGKTIVYSGGNFIIDFYSDETSSHAGYSAVCYPVPATNKRGEALCKSIGSTLLERKAGNGANLYAVDII